MPQAFGRMYVLFRGPDGAEWSETWHHRETVIPALQALAMRYMVNRLKLLAYGCRIVSFRLTVEVPMHLGNLGTTTVVLDDRFLQTDKGNPATLTSNMPGLTKAALLLRFTEG